MISAGGPSRWRRRVLLLVWLSSAAYVWGFVDRGWVPHDEGMLSANAERVLYGEQPHRDFDESYTGGLTQLHAAAFRLLGVRLLSLRFVLFASFLLFVPVCYALAARLLPPWGAGLLTLVCVAWSVPNYFASVPSWYVLFLSTFGTYALARELETGRRAWLFLAGLCGGLAILVLVVGLYYVAGALLHLAFREQRETRPDGAGSPGFLLFQLASVAGFAAALWLLLRSHLGVAEVVQFVLPPLSVAAVFLVFAWRGRTGESAKRFEALFRRVAPFGAGVIAPVALFLVPYAVSGGLSALYRGLLVVPFRQIEAASLRLPALASFAAAAPYAGLLVVLILRPRLGGRALVLVLAGLCAALLAVSGTPEGYRFLWHSARSLGVAAVFVGAWSLLSFGRGRSPFELQQTFLLITMAAMLGLLQFPYAAPIYFCYVAPLAAMALAAIAREGPLPPHAVVATLYLLFALSRLNPGYIWRMGVRPEVYGALKELDLPRAGLRVPVEDRATYTALVARVGERGGDYLYAAPDCPEVAFLAGRRNPTRVVFDYAADRPAAEKLVGLLRAKGVLAVVMNTRPDYSQPLDDATQRALEREFPKSESIGRFVLRWRE